ncbi:hypothetical protein HOY82DRAFT_544097 [Tuber indicum]|nr:hypothetical protein HOY82DRAFT_544097 [Tuber indicum]
MSEIVVNLLFGTQSPVYTVPKLVRLFHGHSQDIRTVEVFRNALYNFGYRDVLYDNPQEGRSTVTLKDSIYGTFFQMFRISLHDVPTINYQFPQVRKLNLASWVLSITTPEIQLQMPPRPDFNVDSIIVPLSQFASLFSPLPVTGTVISYLSRLWDKGAMYGWLSLSLPEASTLLADKRTKSFRHALQSLYNSQYQFTEIHHVLLPVETPETYYLLVCTLERKYAQVYNWIAKSDHSIWLSKTLMDLEKLPVFMYWNFKAVNEDPTDGEVPLSKRQIGLFMLYGIRYSLNRMRLTTVQGSEEDRVSFDQIVTMCLRDVFVETQRMESCVLPIAK